MSPEERRRRWQDKQNKKRFERQHEERLRQEIDQKMIAMEKESKEFISIWVNKYGIPDPTPARAILLEKARTRKGFNEAEFFGENEITPVCRPRL